MWLLMVFAVVVLVLAIRKSLSLFGRGGGDPPKSRDGLDGILFWGCISLLTGFLAHFTGIYQAMLAISRAGDISPAVVARGYAESLITVLSGLLICVVSALVWFLLRCQVRKQAGA